MSGFICGQSRNQSTLFPELLDDFIDESNLVRVIDVFVDEIDLDKFGFIRTSPKSTGRPGYDPATLLKIYIYVYLNRIQSSRHLELEAQRNIELMWLTGRLAPDFKTIADFRKDNGKGIKNTCSEFVKICRDLKLFEDSMIAVDGSKFKAVNSRENNYTPARVKVQTERIEKQIEKYMKALDDADKAQQHSTLAKEAPAKIKNFRKRLRRLQEISVLLNESSENQISFTDPDARAMKVRSGSATIGYNVQTAVDTKNHLIAAHYVTNAPTDRGILGEIGLRAKEVLGKDNLTLLADKGYYRGADIKDMQDVGVTPILPKPDTSGSGKRGIFNRSQFKYHAESDTYVCPGGSNLPFSSTTVDKGQDFRIYVSKLACDRCSLRAKCTTSPNQPRRVKRWVHEDRLDKMEAQLNAFPESMLLRKQTVEHPFGTIKFWMGATHFLTKGLENVSTEMSLNVLSYNMKRVISIIGTQALIEAING